MQTLYSTRIRIIFWIIILAGLLLTIPQLLSTSAGETADILLINEFLAANQTGLADEDGHYSDWIEIYNPGRQPVNLAGWSLTDDPNQPEKWTFPSLVLGGQEYLLLFASGKDRRSVQPDSTLHTNFKLNQTTEFLGLYNTLHSRFIDVASPSATHPQIEPKEKNEYPRQFADVSYGRLGRRPDSYPDESIFGYLATPTPGQPNADKLRWIDLVAPVRFSVERGFYETPFSLTLSTATSGATIRYTTDGSEPTKSHGIVYTGPITVTATSLVRAAAFKPSFRPAPVSTHTYIFLEDVLNQPSDPAGFPKSWGGYKGSLVKADYEMDPEVIEDPRYKTVVKDALTSIPTLSIVTDIKNFHDLYANPRRRGRAWERPVSVELMTADHQQDFQINAGIRVQGELGRAEYMPKHAFRLFFRNEYGTAKLHYPLFPDSPVTAFDTLVLRSGVNRSYAGYPERENDYTLTTYTRDEWLRASQIAMSGSGARGIFVHLYLNGLYWGLYNLVERPDESFMSSYFGGAKAEWQTITHAETVDNASARFKALHQLAAEGHLEDPERYNAIRSYLDIPHFIDYLILNWYAGNLDWGFNNWYAAVEQQSGQVKYFVWDGERTWYEGAEIYMELDEYLGRPNLVKPLFKALLANPDFKIMLADRIYKHLFDDGALTETNALARWLKLNNLVEQAIIGESARWGDTRQDTPLTQEDWFEARDDVLAQMKDNVSKFIALAREADYYPDLDPPQFSQQGGQVAAGFSLTMSLSSAEGAAIYYTTDGTDPRLSGAGAVAPAASIYQAPLILTTTTQIRSRAFDGKTWSALNEASFSIKDELTGHLQITEIMYNPAGGSAYEFIELKNGGKAHLDLANISFEGISFTFPPVSASLAPGELIVLVRDPVAFAEKYPDAAIGGMYQGQLANEGEKIDIKDASGNVLISLEYDDENSWPISPDGRGDSLVLIDPNRDPNDPKSWQASSSPGGAPGIDESMLESQLSSFSMQESH